MELTTLLNNGTLVKDRYLILKPLGRGGFGQTYLVQDQQCFEEVCVLKQFSPLHTSREVLKKSEELFNREAQVLYSLKHEQIPKLRAYFQWQEQLFLVQDFIEGKNYLNLLYDRQQHNQGFTVKEILDWLLDLLPVLGYIHQQKLVHRDIAPDNIMFSEKLQKPVLIDFGIVRNELSNSTGVAGRYGFSAPEQIRFGNCYPSSDLYSLAVTSLVLLTGRKPEECFDSHSNQWHWQDYLRLDQTLTGVLRKMLAERPQERYQSAEEVLAVLQPYRQQYEQKTLLQPELPESRPIIPILASLAGIVGAVVIIPRFYPLPIICELLKNCTEESPVTTLYENPLNEETVDSLEAMLSEAEAALAQTKTAANVTDLETARDRLLKAMEDLRNSQQGQESISKYETELQQLEIRITREQDLAKQVELFKSQLSVLQIDTENEEVDTIPEHRELQSRWQELKTQVQTIPPDTLAYKATLPMLTEIDEKLALIETKIQEIKPLW